jgi:hypothetical protein
MSKRLALLMGWVMEYAAALVLAKSAGLHLQLLGSYRLTRYAFASTERAVVHPGPARTRLNIS